MNLEQRIKQVSQGIESRRRDAVEHRKAAEIVNCGVGVKAGTYTLPMHMRPVLEKALRARADELDAEADEYIAIVTTELVGIATKEGQA